MTTELTSSFQDELAAAMTADPPQVTRSPRGSSGMTYYDSWLPYIHYRGLTVLVQDHGESITVRGPGPEKREWGWFGRKIRPEVIIHSGQTLGLLRDVLRAEIRAEQRAETAALVHQADTRIRAAMEPNR